MDRHEAEEVPSTSFYLFVRIQCQTRNDNMSSFILCRGLDPVSLQNTKTIVSAGSVRERHHSSLLKRLKEAKFEAKSGLDQSYAHWQIPKFL